MRIKQAVIHPEYWRGNREYMFVMEPDQSVSLHQAHLSPKEHNTLVTFEGYQVGTKYLDCYQPDEWNAATGVYFKSGEKVIVVGLRTYKETKDDKTVNKTTIWCKTMTQEMLEEYEQEQ